MTIGWNESLESVADSVNVPHPVIVMKLHDQGSYDVVNTGTKPSAGNNRRTNFGMIEINLFTWAGLFKRSFFSCLIAFFNVVKYPSIIWNKLKILISAFEIQLQG